MAIFTQSVSASDVLNAITSDNTAWAGAELARPYGMLDFWSDPAANFSITTSAGDKTLSSVTLPNILSGQTIKAAYAMVHFGTVLETSGANNYTVNTHYIQVDTGGGGYTNAIEIADQDITLFASTDERDILRIGDIDIKSKVAFNGTTDFKYAAADANGNNLDCKSVRSGLRVII